MLRAQHDAPAFGELHPIAQQIDEDLSQLAFITTDKHGVIGSLQPQAEMLFLTTVLKHRDQLTQQRREIKIREFDFHAARVDF